MNLFELKQTILENAELGAMAAIRLQNPKFDEVNFREACEIAGERWMRFHIKAENIKPVRKGPAKNSPKLYSRLDIAALKKAERIYAQQ
jgi:hypothetical protein